MLIDNTEIQMWIDDQETSPVIAHDDSGDWR